MFSLELPQRGDSNEYTQYTIFQYKKENHPKLSQICNNGICSRRPKNEFETAVANKPSVFEPLKFYCIRNFGLVKGICDIYLFLYHFSVHIFMVLTILCVKHKDFYFGQIRFFSNFK